MLVAGDHRVEMGGESMGNAVEFALASPYPEPEAATNYVYA